jgi:hypothetical protein
MEAGTTPRTSFIAGNNERAANTRTGNNVSAARRMTQHHRRTRSDVMTPLERMGRGFIGGCRSGKAILRRHLLRPLALLELGLSPAAKGAGSYPD